MAMAPTQRERDVQRGIRLEYLTVGWNVLEGAVAIVAGSIAGSVALVGFGLDSAIESSSGAVLLWRLRAERNGENVERIEQTALKLVGIGFLLLAAYIAFDSTGTLLSREAPRRSVVGIALSLASLVVMPLLAKAKRRTASDLNSAALHADSRQTSICAYLSAIGSIHQNADGQCQPASDMHCAAYRTAGWTDAAANRQGRLARDRGDHTELPIACNVRAGRWRR
jgi:divalent metal cation (Fe/Co/Zn/Cd) transporter